MTQKSRTDLQTEIVANINDNTSGEITAADVRNSLQDIADSCFNTITDGPVVSGLTALEPLEVDNTDPSNPVLNLSSVISASYGGTGNNTYTQGDLLYYDSGANLSKLAKNTSATSYLSNGGTNNNPAWAQVNLTNGVSGVLPVTNGGTGTSTALTAGSMVFAGPGGTLSQDNANLFWDNTNKRFGVGTAAPNAAFEVVTSAFGEARFRNTTASSYTSFRFLNDRNSDFYSVLFGMTGSTSAGIWTSGLAGEQAFYGTTAAHPLTMGTNGTQRAMIDGNTGFFGINTKTPSARLQVNGPVLVSDTTGTLGTEKVTNGTFTGSDTGWTVGTGWAYGTNNESKNADGTGTLSQNVSTVAGEFYLLTYVISNWTVGTVTPTLGGVATTAATANGSYSSVIRAVSTGNLIFTPSNTSRFTIDTVSVKRIMNGTLSVAGPTYMAGSTASRASLNIATGVAPTAPVDGDLWYDGTNLNFRVGGTTKTVTLV